MPPAASTDSHGQIGAEELIQSPRELTDPGEIGNLTPLHVFEFIQFAMKLDTALKLVLGTVLVKNLNLAWHERNAQRVPPGVFCYRIPLS
jgi:hypothetical protein